MSELQKIAFIGLGIMGAPIARNLMKAGFELHVWARRREKAQPLLAEGAVWHDSAAEVARSADAVITMLGEPKDVESVWLGESGLMTAARPGTIMIDMTTSSPSLAARLHDEGGQRGLRVLDCPVTGGRAGAENAKLARISTPAPRFLRPCRPAPRTWAKPAPARLPRPPIRSPSPAF